MPYKKAYTTKTIKKGNTRTPDSVMGGQGKAVTIKPMHQKMRPTGNKQFTAK